MNFFSLSFWQKSPRGRVVYRSNNNANANGGVANANASNAPSNSNANIGSRLNYLGSLHCSGCHLIGQRQVWVRPRMLRRGRLRHTNSEPSGFALFSER
jgi:hypothetical protein